MARWRVREIAEPECWSARKLAQATGLAYNTVWAIWANKAKRADLDYVGTNAIVEIRGGRRESNWEDSR